MAANFSGGATLIGLVTALLVAPGAAVAQTASTITAPAPTREEINRAAPGPDVRGPSRLTVEGGIERAPCPLAEERFKDVTVQINEVVFDNLRAVAPETLRPAYAEFVGRTVPIAAVCEIRDAAATMLRRQGYLAAVQVPAQRIENGVVHFDVLMAKLVAVQVRGDAGRAERLIAGYLNQLKNRQVFNEREAERYMLLARDLPGFDVRLTLKPANGAPGEVIGEVTVAKTPFAIDANVQNFGSRQVGRFGGLVRGEVYDALGFGDRLTVGFFATPEFDEQKVVQLGYDMRLGSEGLTLGGRFTFAKTEPDIEDATAVIQSRTWVGAVELNYPFLRTQSGNVRGAAGFELINQNVNFAGLRVSEDRLRILFARADFDFIDRASLVSTTGFSAGEPRWRVAGSLELRKGLGAFDATDRCGPAPSFARCRGQAAVQLEPSRPEGDARAGLVRLTAIGEYRPVPDITFSLSPRAQYSRRALLSYEEFSAGNYTAGRGYDPGSLIGDSGVGVQGEVRFGRANPRTRDEIAVQSFLFVDKAWVWNRTFQGQRLGSDPQELDSYGVGARATWGDRARLEVTYAKPNKRLPPAFPGDRASRAGDRLLITLSTRLWPW